MRKLPVVCAFALLLVNPCLSIAATTETTKISTFCRNELQKTSYDRLPWLGSELYSMISKGQVESSIAQINRIIDIAVKSKNKSLSTDLERLLGDNLFWRQSEVARFNPLKYLLFVVMNCKKLVTIEFLCWTMNYPQ